MSALPAWKNCAIKALVASFHARAAIKPNAAVARARMSLEITFLHLSLPSNHHL